jgi:protoporphyrinogen/coproporphyrinogen III oxidase
MTSDRIVIGTGIAGLLSALRATERGESVTLVGTNLGGLISQQSFSVGAFDSGAEAFSTVTPEVLEFLDKIGLAGSVVTPSGAAANIISDTGRYKIPLGIMGIPASLTDPELLKIFSPEQLSNAMAADAQEFGAYKTVADLVRARLGEAFLEKLVNPVFSGVHGSSADRISADAVLGPLLQKAGELNSLTAAVAATKSKQLRPGASVASLIGGMGTLVSKLQSLLTEAGCQFEFAEVEAARNEAGSWVVESASGSHQGRNLSICTPVEFLAQNLKGFAELSDAAKQIKTVDVSLVMLLVQSQQLNSQPLGPGALITESAGFKAKATTHVNAKWEWLDQSLDQDQHLIRLSFGRNGQMPVGNLIRIAEAELSEIYQVTDVSVLESQLVRWPNALVQPDQSATENLRNRISELRDLNLEVAGGYLTGNGILGIVKDHQKRRAA